eukprot:176393-Amphidinium_carterae.1
MCIRVKHCIEKAPMKRRTLTFQDVVICTPESKIRGAVGRYAQNDSVLMASTLVWDWQMGGNAAASVCNYAGYKQTSIKICSHKSLIGSRYKYRPHPPLLERCEKLQDRSSR